MTERIACPNQGWEQLPTEELDEILKAELRKEHPNEEVVLPILQILEDREKDIPETPDVLNTLKKLSKHKTSSKHSTHTRGWIAATAAAAAVVCIILMAIPRTVGAQSVFQALFRWTSSIFEMSDPDCSESYPGTDSGFVTDHPGLQELSSKVTQLGAKANVVPTWLPDGFSLTEIKEIPMPGGSKLYANFNNSNESVSITYRITDEGSAKFEKENTGFEVIEAGGVSHIIVENDDHFSVTWKNGNVECLFSTNIEKETLYTIIESIYRSELSK